MSIGARRVAARGRCLALILGASIASGPAGRVTWAGAHTRRIREPGRTGFVEPRRGDVPEGSPGLITPEAGREIESGLD